MSDMIKKSILIACLATPLVLSGCGGGGGGGAVAANGNGGGAALTSITGVVIDDKIDGALVCLDANANNSCDVGELTATSMNGGVYTLNNVPAADVNARLIAMVDSNTAFLVVNGVQTPFPYPTNVAFATPGGQKDVKGYQNITPLTTLVERVAAKTGASIADAAAIVKQRLRIISGVDILGDYTAVVAGDSIAIKTDKDKLLKVARVSTRVIADNYAAINDAGVTGSTADRFTVSIDQLLNNIESVGDMVDQYTAATLDPYAVAKAAVPTITAASAQQLLNNVAAAAAATPVANTTLLTSLSQGFNYVWSSVFVGTGVPATQASYYINKMKFNGTTGVVSHQSWYTATANNYTAWQGNNYNSWVLDTYAQQNLTLDPVTGVIANATSTVDVLGAQLNANGTITVPRTTGSQQTSSTIRGIALTGQTIASVVNVPEHGAGWQTPFTAVGATFTSPYAQAFDMVETAVTDRYTVWAWNDPAQCAYYGVPYTPTVNCQVMPMMDIYGAVWNAATGTSTPATTLADIIVVNPYANTLDPNLIAATDPYGNVGWGWLPLATSKTATSGKVRYYDFTALTNGIIGTAKPRLIGVATWTKQMMGNTPIIVIQYPAAVQAFYQAQQGFSDTGEFFVASGGYVYSGGIVAAGTVMPSRAFNNAALQDMKSAIGIPGTVGAP